jgi:hypothetical protein
MKAGFIASLVSVIVIWIRYGSPIAEDISFFMQPLWSLGLMTLFLISIVVENRKPKKQNDKA